MQLCSGVHTVFEKYLDNVEREQTRVGQIYESIFCCNPIQESLNEGISKALVGGLVGSALGAGAGYIAGGKYGEQLGTEITGQIDASGQRMADNAGRYIDDATTNLNNRIGNFANATKKVGSEFIDSTTDQASQFVGTTMSDFGQNAATALQDTMVGTQDKPGLSWHLRNNSDKIAGEIADHVRRNVKSVELPKVNPEKASILPQGVINFVNKGIDATQDGMVSYVADAAHGATFGGVQRALTSPIPDAVEFTSQKAGDSLKQLADTTGASAATRIKQLGSDGVKNFGAAVDRETAAAQAEVAGFGADMKKGTQQLIRGAYDDVKPIVSNTATKLGKFTGAGIGASVGGLAGTVAGASMQNNGKDKDKNKDRRHHA